MGGRCLTRSIYRGDTCESGWYNWFKRPDRAWLLLWYNSDLTPFSPGSFSVNLASPHTYYNGANHLLGGVRWHLLAGTTYYYRAFCLMTVRMGWTWEWVRSVSHYKILKLASDEYIFLQDDAGGVHVKRSIYYHFGINTYILIPSES